MEALLKDRFMAVQQVLQAGLQANRDFTSHSGSKGTGAEIKWQEMLQDHLPARYQVTTGFVIDSQGHESEQIDVIIHDRQYSPLMWNPKHIHYVPVESVYAVFDSKQSLNPETLRQCGEKAHSVRQLVRTSAQVYHIEGVSRPKPLHSILAGVLCLETEWTPGLEDTFCQHISQMPIGHQLDLGCAIKDGGFEVLYEDVTPMPTIERSQPDTALIFFFLRLLHRLQKLGTAPAIDFCEYSKGL